MTESVEPFPLEPEQVEQAQLPGVADPEGWRRLHPVTPFLRSWKIIAALLVIAAHQGLNELSTLIDQVERGLNVGLVGMSGAGIVLLIGVWAWLSWRMTRYRVRGDTLEHEVGILFRQHRQARLDRLQAVDVVQPLLGRIFGLAELRLEVAGGHGSDVKLQYLRDSEADQLRNVLLARAAGVSYAGPEAPVAPEHRLVALSPGRLLGSLALSPETFAAVLLLIGVGVGAAFEPAALFSSIPIVIAAVSAVWARFSRGFNFTAAISPDGLRLRHGLLETRTQTVPPGRVQAVSLTQPLLWRLKGWWLVRVNVAGYGPGEHDKQSTHNVLMPVATQDEAFLLLAQVVPDLGIPDALGVLQDGLTGLAQGPDNGGLGAGARLTDASWEADEPGGQEPAVERRPFTCAPQRAVWLDPIGWRRIGFVVTETVLLIRSGRLHRRLQIVPHARTQSLGLTQGWLQRRLRLASFVCHSTPGPVAPAVRHLDQRVAGDLLIRQATRAQQARLIAPQQRWMASGQVAKPVPGPPVVDLVKAQPAQS